jgi:hypothetical protein
MIPIWLFTSDLSSAHFLFRDNLINLLVLLLLPEAFTLQNETIFFNLIILIQV